MDADEFAEPCACTATTEQNNKAQPDAVMEVSGFHIRVPNANKRLADPHPADIERTQKRFQSNFQYWARVVYSVAADQQHCLLSTCVIC